MIAKTHDTDIDLTFPQAQRDAVDMRAAANIVAIGRVATVTRLRGMYA
jgi:glutamate dehydrogenase/leucine dehydrogenase